MVISFSVINYVVSMRHPRVSDEVSFFLYMLYIKNETHPPPVLKCSDSPEGHDQKSMRGLSSESHAPMVLI